MQNASLSGLDAGNYTLGTTGGTATATIAQRTLNLGYTGVDKVYDGVTGAQVAISDDRIAGDVLSASASAAFADKNAGSGKAVAVQNRGPVRHGRRQLPPGRDRRRYQRQYCARGIDPGQRQRQRQGV